MARQNGGSLAWAALKGMNLKAGWEVRFALGVHWLVEEAAEIRRKSSNGKLFMIGVVS